MLFLIILLFLIVLSIIDYFILKYLIKYHALFFYEIYKEEVISVLKNFNQDVRYDNDWFKYIFRFLFYSMAFYS